MSLYLTALFIVVSCKPQSKQVDVEEASIQNQMLKEEVMDTVGKAYLMGHFDPSQHPLFVEVPAAHADRSGLFMRKEAYEAYVNMTDEAAKAGLKLVIKSATRNFNYQKGIWERKWTGATTLSDGTNLGKTKMPDQTKALKILEYSSMPGTSRHHWGTDIDLNAFTNDWFESGEGLKIYEWLQLHAEDYGFVQVYTPKGPQRPDGYNEEKWHWSYKPISSALTAEAKATLSDDDIMGFKGDKTPTQIGVVEKYILGINKACFH